MRVFRKLLSGERSKLRDHLLRLSRRDRLLRFSGGLSDNAVAAYCDHIDWQRGYVIGCFIEGTLRAVAELQLDDPHRPTRVEVAVSVEAQWQDQGIAAELLRYAIIIARNGGSTAPATAASIRLPRRRAPCSRPCRAATATFATARPVLRICRLSISTP